MYKISKTKWYDKDIKNKRCFIYNRFFHIFVWLQELRLLKKYIIRFSISYRQYSKTIWNQNHSHIIYKILHIYFKLFSKISHQIKEKIKEKIKYKSLSKKTICNIHNTCGIQNIQNINKNFLSILFFKS